MSIGIICKKDGDPEVAIPIMKGDEETGDDTGTMATWETLEDAREFANKNILCQISACIFIDLDGEEVAY